MLYAAVPVGVGVFAFVRRRTRTGRRISPLVLAGVALWGIFGAAPVVVAVVLALLVWALS